MKDKHAKYSRFVISIMSKDRVGIIADVTRTVSSMGGNLADLSQTVLRGYFTMILMADFPEELEAGKVKTELGKLGAGGATIEVAVMDADIPSSTERQDLLRQSTREYVLTVAGKDRIGLVAKASDLLSRNGINILDLATTVDAERYTMIFLLDIASEERLAEIRAKLEELAEVEKLDIALRHNDIFKAINEI